MKSWAAVFLLLAFQPSPLRSADAVALNQEGIEAYCRGDYDKAAVFFTNALEHSPGEPVISANLSAAYRNLATRHLAEQKNEEALSALGRALTQLPRDTALLAYYMALLVSLGLEHLQRMDLIGAQNAAIKALQLGTVYAPALCLAGDVAYARNDLRKAQEHWLSALDANPSDTSVSRRIRRARAESDAERSLSRTRAYRFDIRFDYRALGDGVCDIRSFLMEAYEKIGQDFGRFPEYPITVILSREDVFRNVNSLPDYVSGLYDGKIHVPLNFTKYPLPTLKGILFHEYAHALVYDLAGNRCPLWLNEGIAMKEMNHSLPVNSGALIDALVSGSTLTFEQLDPASGTWQNPRHLQLAYAQSWMMIEYILHRWSFDRLKKILIRFRNGSDFTAILLDEMNRTPGQFEEEWKDFAFNKLDLEPNQ